MDQPMSSIAKELPDADIVLRGPVAIKGKGEMITYWIGPKKSEPR